MEYFYSKYTGEELEERLDRIDDIPELLAEMLTGKNYTTPEDALCIVKKYVPTIYENIPIDNNTIYWANTNDGKVLKARIILSDTDAKGECLWEKKTNIDGKEYLYSKLPVVTAEGITMYADGEGLDIPSIYAGIPFDGVTIHFNKEGKVEVIGGSGEGVSNFWDLSGIPSWITNTKPTYSYSEIQGTPDLSKYALVSQIPSLEGYATESWVLGKGYATVSDLDGRINALINGAPQAYDTLKEIADVLQGNVNSIGDIITTLGGKADKATTLGGYGITDAYTKTNVDNLLKSYVTLAGTQTITGEKDFTGGLKVNGSPLVYNKESGYWKLEGDLLVTGGVSMYSNDTAFTPSTIMDAIVVDGVTISKEGGVLKVVGDTGGGVADSVAWGNVSGKPSWITESAPIIGISGVDVSLGSGISQSALRTALGLGSNAYTSTEYLPLSGGTLENANGSPLRINSTHQGGSAIVFLHNGVDKAWFGYDKNVGRTYMYNTASQSYLGVRDNGTPYFNSYTLWHSGNDGSGSGLDADLLDGKHASSFLWNHTGAYGRYYKVCTITRNREKGHLLLSFCGGHNSAYNLSGVYQLYWAYNANETANSSVTIKMMYGTSGFESSLYAVRTSQYTFDIYFDAGNKGGIVGFQILGRTYSCTIDSFSPIAVDALPTVNYTSSLRDIVAHVSESDKLSTTRYIWGQSFDGTGNVSGDVYLGSKIIHGNSNLDIINSTGNWVILGHGMAESGYITYIDGNEVRLRYGISHTNGLLLNSSGNITIGSSDLAGTSSKLYVAGKIVIPNSYEYATKDPSGNLISAVCMASNTDLVFGDGTFSKKYWTLLKGYKIGFYTGTTAVRAMLINDSGNITIGQGDLATSNYKLYVDGIVRATNYIYSDSLLWFKKGSEGIYIGHNAICWHNSGAAWVSNLIGFESNKVTINQSTTVQGDFLSTGGITMYSARKLKDIKDEKGLSLEELSTIKPTRFTWKDGIDNRIHIGGIADDVMKVLPEVIYKTDNDTLTMDYGNAAFAIAASLIKPVVNHEERIKMLEEENERLKREIEQLKWHIA